MNMFKGCKLQAKNQETKKLRNQETKMEKTIVITGAAGNLGKAVVHELIEKDYHIEATLGPNEEADFYDSDHLNAQPLNLLDPVASEAYINHIAGTHSSIEGAVLIVGGFAMGNIEETKTDDLQKMYKLNFETAYNMVRPLIKVFKKQPEGGQIIMIGSRAAINPDEGKNFISYSLSKSLIFRLSEFINAEYNDKNIFSHVIVPATMDTPANRSGMPDADFNSWVPTERVAETISFALSDAGKMLRESVFKVYNKA